MFFSLLVGIHVHIYITSGQMFWEINNIKPRGKIVCTAASDKKKYKDVEQGMRKTKYSPYHWRCTTYLMLASFV